MLPKVSIPGGISSFRELFSSVVYGDASTPTVERELANLPPGAIAFRNDGAGALIEMNAGELQAEPWKFAGRANIYHTSEEISKIIPAVVVVNDAAMRSEEEVYPPGSGPRFVTGPQEFRTDDLPEPEDNLTGEEPRTAVPSEIRTDDAAMFAMPQEKIK